MSRVLIVEDDELIAELERDYLEAGGFEVEVDLSGENARFGKSWPAAMTR